MSAATTGEKTPKSAVPVPDLSALDEAITRGTEALREAVRRFRPAGLGRDLSRRTTEEGRRILEAIDERRAAAMLVGARGGGGAGRGDDDARPARGVGGDGARCAGR